MAIYTPFMKPSTILTVFIFALTEAPKSLHN
jgi:hypothetical protein